MKLKMDFISAETLNEKSPKNRINFILKKIKEGKIIVTDASFEAKEEMELIKETMRRVDDGFPGIEVCSMKRQTKGFKHTMEILLEQKNRVQKLLSFLRGIPPPKLNLKTGLTLIGPAKFIKQIKKKPDSFSVMAEA